MPDLKKLAAIATGLAMMSALPAYATVTVINETGETRTVTIDRGAVEAKHELAPNASIQDACGTSCGVRFGGHDYIATDGETLAIIPGSTRPVPRDG